MSAYTGVREKFGFLILQPARALPAIGSRNRNFKWLRYKFALARGSGKENQRNRDFSRKKCEFDDLTPHQP
ncbi:MAG: hypothetical protein FWG74_03670 [Planctomycetes bacterium]|nr:hypothetical protein [Planctomycetota bacterium]